MCKKVKESITPISKTIIYVQSYTLKNGKQIWLEWKGGGVEKRVSGILVLLITLPPSFSPRTLRYPETQVSIQQIRPPLERLT